MTDRRMDAFLKKRGDNNNNNNNNNSNNYYYYFAFVRQVRRISFWYRHSV